MKMNMTLAQGALVSQDVDKKRCRMRSCLGAVVRMFVLLRAWHGP